MRSNLGRFHRPMSRGAMGNMLMMNNLGDGSTLNLDFTTGVLDSRLTFSRASTATFVNSSGYVQFANANCFTFSNPRQTGTAWSATGSVTWNGTGGIADPIGGTNAQSITFGTAASAIFNTSGTTVVSGITHTFSVWLRAASGTTNARIGDANVGAVSTVTLTTTWQRFSCQYVSSGTNDGGAIYSQTVTASAEMYVWGAQVQPGSIAGDLIQTSGTQNYSTPRFDYSPTTIGEPRGLLIEGQTTNHTKYSEAFTNAYWNTTANNVTAADSVATSPTGVALTASTLTEIAGTVSRHVHQVTGEFTPAASTAYTMSCFVKQPTSNAIRYVQLAFWSAGFGLTAYMNYDLQTGTVGTGGAGITAPSITAYPNGWYRITATATSIAVPGSSGFQLGFSTTSGAVRTESYTASAPLKSIQLFGAQVEVGSGATSYISTGASQVTRNADSCVMNDISSLSYSTTNGSMYYEGRFEKLNASSFPVRSGFVKETGDVRTFALITNSAGSEINVKGSGGTPAVSLNPSLVVNTNFKLAWTLDAALSSGEVRKSNNGAAVTSSTASALTATEIPSYFMFGQKGYDLFFPSGTIKKFKYWPTTLSDNTIREITT